MPKGSHIAQTYRAAPQRPPFSYGPMTRRPLPQRAPWIRQLTGSLGLAFFSMIAATAVVGVLPPATGALGFVGVLMAATYLLG